MCVSRLKRQSLLLKAHQDPLPSRWVAFYGHLSSIISFWSQLHQDTPQLLWWFRSNQDRFVSTGLGIRCPQKKNDKRNIIQFNKDGRLGLSDSWKESYFLIWLQSALVRNGERWCHGKKFRQGHYKLRCITWFWLRWVHPTMAHFFHSRSDRLVSNAVKILSWAAGSDLLSRVASDLSASSVHVDCAENLLIGLSFHLIDEPSEGRYCKSECVGLADILPIWFRGEILFTLLQKTDTEVIPFWVIVDGHPQHLQAWNWYKRI